MNHEMAISAQHSEVGRHIISDRDPLLEAGNRFGRLAQTVVM